MSVGQSAIRTRLCCHVILAKENIAKSRTRT